MLTALDGSDALVLARDADTRGTYVCPECRTQLIVKAGAIVTRHFAHRARISCSLAVGESQRHMQMKEQVGGLFAGRVAVAYEKSIVPGRRADLVLGERIVVECQDSPISILEWAARTRDYNRAGHPVLWIWDITRVCGSRWVDSFEEIDLDAEWRLPAELRYCHQCSFGRVYVLDAAGNLKSCHLARVATRESEWIDENHDQQSSSYTPRSLRHISFRETASRIEPFTGPRGHRLTSLGEGAWWKRQ